LKDALWMLVPLQCCSLLLLASSRSLPQLLCSCNSTVPYPAERFSCLLKLRLLISASPCGSSCSTQAAA
jgi:hypothetical protein